LPIQRGIGTVAFGKFTRQFASRETMQVLTTASRINALRFTEIS
jgi:hypothetical protein